MGVSTDWFKEHNHNLLFFNSEFDLRKLELGYIVSWDRLTNDEIVSVPRIHTLPSIFKDGNFRELKDWEASFGLDKGVVSRELFWGIEEQGQHDRDELGFNVWMSGFVVTSFLNETIPWRQRGHGTEPGGPFGELDELLVEQRYKAHPVHNSCKQPIN